MMAIANGSNQLRRIEKVLFLVWWDKKYFIKIEIHSFI